MKQTILTLILVAIAIGAHSQCSSGGNGVASTTPITIDGNVSDWNPILADPDNNTYDAVPDLDAPIADVGRDFTRFAFTENYSSVFLFFSRAGSAKNAVDVLFYMDVNNNGFMETNEPVIAISWSGSNGAGKVDIYNYVQAASGGDVITNDGTDMPGSLLLRNSLGTIGKGTSDGLSLEVAIPFTQLYKQGSSDPADILTPTEQFKFHISTINGSPTSVPGPNAINDNFSGCYSGLIILPVKLAYFDLKDKQTGVELSWVVSDNENAAKFEIEASNDGKNFESIGIVVASKNSAKQAYSYTVSENQSSYYRLKIINANGGIEYSKILVTNSANPHKLNVKVNNPVYSDVTILYESAQNETCSIRLFTTAGIQVYTQKANISSGTNKLVIPDNHLCMKGTYFLELVNGRNERSVQKLVKM
jgi:hypothetical protein